MGAAGVRRPVRARRLISTGGGTMSGSQVFQHRASRRGVLRAAAGSALLAAAPVPRRPSVIRARADEAPLAQQSADTLFARLDAKIQAAMAEHQIPGVAVGAYYQGQEYVRGYGVTNVDYPQPVDGDTLFRIGSTTKRLPAPTAIRLVEQGRPGLV